jgi:hypothetical protein
MAELSVHQSVLLTDLALCVNQLSYFPQCWPPERLKRVE